MSSTPQVDTASDSEGSSDDDELRGASRSDLLLRIQDLTERNERLETRFRDVVGAYKNVLTEKKALEDTVSALSSTGDDVDGAAAAATDEGNGDDAAAEVDSSAQAATATAAAAEATAVGSAGRGGASDGGAAAAALQKKVKALGQAVATLNDEKRTLQDRFQSDKKIVAEAHRDQLDELTAAHTATLEKLAGGTACAENENASLKATVHTLSEQLRAGHDADKKREREWEKERQAHKKELEAVSQLKASEGETSDKLFEMKKELQSARDAELDALQQLSSTSTELKDKIGALEEELAAATKQLVSAESIDDSSQVLDLKKEVSRLQKKCADWQNRAEGAEAEGAEAAKAAQSRIAESEDKLAMFFETAQLTDQEVMQSRVTQENRLGDLAAVVGRYEASRVADSEAITELSDECAELRRQLKSSGPGGPDGPPADTSARAGGPDGREEALEAQVHKLQNMLDIANQQLMESQNRDIGHSVAIEIPAPSWATIVSAELDIDKIKVEGEMYYRKAQSANAEVNRIKAEVARASAGEREATSKLHRLVKAKDGELEAAVAEWKTEAIDLREKLRVRESVMEDKHSKAVDELRAKTLKMRDRALALVRDRDVEIARLRHRLKLTPPAGQEGDAPLTSAEELTNGADSVRRISNQSPRRPGRTVHDVMGQQYGNKEIATARVKIRELEGTILDMRDAGGHLEEQSSALKEEIRRLERNARREGANLEYLKNILVNYMSYKVGREQSLIAVATILQFSPRELMAVKTAQPETAPSVLDNLPGWGALLNRDQ